MGDLPFTVILTIPRLEFLAVLSTQGRAEGSQLEKLKQIINREPLAPIFEQEKDLVWEGRFVSSIFKSKLVLTC